MKRLFRPEFWFMTFVFTLAITFFVALFYIIFSTIGHYIWFGIPIVIVSGVFTHILLEDYYG